MAFVNEFVPDEDVQKYGVADLWDHYRPYMLGKRAPGFRHDWTVDKERKEFLMLVDIGREEFSNRHTFVLYLDGMVVEARLDKGGSGSLIEPVLTSWELVQLKVPAASTLTREQIVQTLKKALVEFKVAGVRWPVSDHTAVFDF